MSINTSTTSEIFDNTVTYEHITAILNTGSESCRDCRSMDVDEDDYQRLVVNREDGFAQVGTAGGGMFTQWFLVCHEDRLYIFFSTFSSLTSPPSYSWKSISRFEIDLLTGRSTIRELPNHQEPNIGYDEEDSDEEDEGSDEEDEGGVNVTSESESEYAPSDDSESEYVPSDDSDSDDDPDENPTPGLKRQRESDDDDDLDDCIGPSPRRCRRESVQTRFYRDEKFVPGSGYKGADHYDRKFNGGR